MNNRKISLAVMLVLIFSLIFYLESTRPNIGNLNKYADVNITAGSLEAEKRISLKRSQYEPAKELVSPEGYINIDNISIAENIGKNVMLVDFWTYSCVNCQRTLPYLTGWYEKYKDAGLVIIGVHSPEFEFEKEYDNVLKAAKKYGIKYPIVQDNDKQIWNAYHNRYWPRKYLIDIDGFIVYDHIGEGAYAETEVKIQNLLLERKNVLGTKENINMSLLSPLAKPISLGIPTGEIYFGYDFARAQLGNIEGWQPEKEVEYSIPKIINQDKFYLEGTWKNNNDNMELVSETGKIILKYGAKEVNLVAGSKVQKEIIIKLDGEISRKINVSTTDLYNLVEDKKYDKQELEIDVPNGVRVYTFTFG